MSVLMEYNESVNLIKNPLDIASQAGNIEKKLYREWRKAYESGDDKRRATVNSRKYIIDKAFEEIRLRIENDNQKTRMVRIRNIQAGILK